MESSTPGQMRSPRVTELVAAELRRRIVSGECADELPREAELQEEFGVSRPSMREAFRILETEGLIQIRRGKVGGAVVRLPTAESAAYHLGLVLQAKKTPLADLADARALLEPLCAGLVAESADREAIGEALEKLIDESETAIGEDAEKFTQAALRFHRHIVDSCANQTMQMLAGALEAVWNSQEQQWAADAIRKGAYPELADQREVVRAHRRIANHIAKGNSQAATMAMEKHLSLSQSVVAPDGASVEVARGRSSLRRPGQPEWAS